MNRNYLCSVCGTPCHYNNGRPFLVCDCTKNQRWVDDYDIRGGYWENINGAKVIPVEDYIPNKKVK